MSSYGPLFDARSAAVRSEGICYRCQREFHPSLLDAHHPIPREMGGSDYDPPIPLCDECHPIVERETKARLGLLFYLQPPRYRLAGRVKRPPQPKVRARPKPQPRVVGRVRATPPSGLYRS